MTVLGTRITFSQINEFKNKQITLVGKYNPEDKSVEMDSGKVFLKEITKIDSQASEGNFVEVIGTYMGNNSLRFIQGTYIHGDVGNEYFLTPRSENLL